MPLLNYGVEIWTITDSDVKVLNMLKRVIVLRTIYGSIALMVSGEHVTTMS